jgi:beta-lactamase regulating signal transducer with metallopeptidase domain
MDRFHSLFDSQFVYALGWTIVHSFWQSLLVFTLLGLSLLMSKRSRPEIRYWLSMAALVCCLLISIKTFIYCYHDVLQASNLLAQLQNTLDIAQNRNWWVTTFKTINPWLDNIVLVWCIGFFVHIVLYIYDIAVTQRLKHHFVSVVPSDWNKRLDALAQKIGVTKTVSFLHSSKVSIPSVIGHFKPVVLLPLGILTQLPQAQIEAIVLHELAHIKRHDYLINILQSLVKVLFFFNPFVLSICKKIDIERENICDDLAVKTCGDPLIFANSLSQFADVTPTTKSAMAASKDKYLLLARVKRLFSTQGKLSTSTERLIALLCAGLLGLTLNVNAQQPQLALEPTTQKTAPLLQITAQNLQPAVIEATPIADDPLTLDTSASNSSDQVKNNTRTAIIAEPAKISKNKVEAATPIKATQKFIPLAEVKNTPEKEVTVREAIKPQKDTVLLAQQKTEPSTSAAVDYVESKNNAKVTKVDDNLQKNAGPKGRVYAETPTFKVFSLESPLILENIDQLIFAPISTSETQLSSRVKNWKSIASQYFSELQNKQPRMIALGNLQHSTSSYSDMSASLIAQIRIKDVQMYDTRRINYQSASWRINSSSKTSGEQRKSENRRIDENRYKSNPGPETTQNASSKNENPPPKNLGLVSNDTQLKFAWDVAVEVILVHANSYEYAGYATKYVRLDSSILEPSEINKARHSGSNTKAERKADIIKNAWDILVEHIQNDVYQVASAIKNKELKLTSVAALMDKPSPKDTPAIRNLESQYLRVEDSEFEEFIISSIDSLDNFKQATYSPILTKQVELKSTQSAWKQRLNLALHHLSNQPEQIFRLPKRVPFKTDTSSAVSDQNLLVQIKFKEMELYSRAANRSYRSDSELARGSNYNRGATASGIGMSPSKDDVGGATVRKITSLKPSNFDTKLYLQGKFEITLLDSQTHQVLGHALSVNTVNPKHSEFKKVAKQIHDQNMEISREEMLIIALFEQVKTQLHKELQHIQHSEVSVETIQLTTEQAKSIADAQFLANNIN